MMNIKFQNPVFREGLMQTIRKGDKRTSEGYMTLTNGDDKKVGVGYVYMSYMWKFDHIPIEEIRLSHDPNCQTREGLLKAMKTFYLGFKESDWVTIIFFTISEY